MINPMDLSGRRILVTGASSGIGRETAIHLSRLGARLLLVARDQARLDETASRLEGSGHSVAPFDLTKADEIPAWMKTVAAGDPLSGLVHCAGISLIGPLQFLKLASLEATLQINLIASIMLAKGFRQRGVCASPASIVFLSSIGALVGEKGQTAYSASKGALLSVIRPMAKELGTEGIRVNCIAPGWVETEMTAQTGVAIPPESLAEIKARHVLGVGQAIDVANSIAFFLAETGRWITGTTLVVDGGCTVR